jgi:hypothetical protein
VKQEGLNNPTNGRRLGSVSSLVSETIEPLDTDLDIVYMMEGLNNPTNDTSLVVACRVAGEIIEPLPRRSGGYRNATGGRRFRS